jgi:ParB family transcriptional regulator, chromosome partitioning protein
LSAPEAENRSVPDVFPLARGNGLLNPISISAKNVLIAGRNRLEACRKLGWKKIAATVLTLDDIDCQIAEIDENLIRNELSAQEQCLQTARRHELYVSKFPQTKQGGAAGNKGAGRGKAPAIKTADSAVLIGTETPAPPAKQVSFVADTAAKTGIAERTIQQQVQIAKKIQPDVHDAIRDTPVADSKTDLLELARMEPDAQFRKRGAHIYMRHKTRTVSPSTNRSSAQSPRRLGCGPHAG